MKCLKFIFRNLYRISVQKRLSNNKLKQKRMCENNLVDVAAIHSFNIILTWNYVKRIHENLKYKSIIKYKHTKLISYFPIGCVFVLKTFNK